MQEIFKILEQNHSLLIGVAFAWVFFVILASILYRTYKKNKLPKLLDSDVKFSEKMASGRSLKNWATKIGGARNCLVVQVSNDGLLVRPFFPFNLMFLPEVYDLEHFIPLERIKKIEPNNNKIRIDFETEKGVKNSLELRLKQHQKFIDILSI